MQDIRELLHHYQDAGNEISDTVIQRIASIIFRHLNQSPAGSSASSENGLQSYKESFDEILVNVRQLDRRGRGSFMEKLENYISCVLDSAGTVPNQDTNNFNCRPDNECTYLDLTAKQDTFSGNAAGKPNDLLLTLRKKEHSNVPVTASPILADVVAVGHVLPTQISEGNSQGKLEKFLFKIQKNSFHIKTEIVFPFCICSGGAISIAQAIKNLSIRPSATFTFHADPPVE